VVASSSVAVPPEYTLPEQTSHASYFRLQLYRLLCRCYIPVNQYEHTPQSMVRRAERCCHLLSQFKYTQDGTDRRMDIRLTLYWILLDSSPNVYQPRHFPSSPQNPLFPAGLKTYLLHLRFGFGWPVCTFTNYISLLIYLHKHFPTFSAQNSSKTAA